MNSKIKKGFTKLRNMSAKKILLIALPISFIGLIVGSYFIFININKTEIKEDIIVPDILDPPTDENQIFPEIDSKDFYDLIEFENGLPFIGDKMIASIIKDIITRLGTVEGSLSFYITEISLTEKAIYFKWTNKEKEVKKTYIISINSL